MPEPRIARSKKELIALLADSINEPVVFSTEEIRWTLGQYKCFLEENRLREVLKTNGIVGTCARANGIVVNWGAKQSGNILYYPGTKVYTLVKELAKTELPEEYDSPRGLRYLVDTEKIV